MASSSFATHSIKYFFTSSLKFSFVMHCLIWPGKLFQFLAPTNEKEDLPAEFTPGTIKIMAAPSCSIVMLILNTLKLFRKIRWSSVIKNFEHVVHI